MITRATFILLSISIFNIAFAQNDSTTFKYWLTGGIRIDDDLEGSVVANYCFSFDETYFKVGFTEKGGASLFSSGFVLNSDGFLFKTVDVSVGKRVLSRFYMGYAFIGPSYVFGKKKLSDNTPGAIVTENISTVGVNVESGICLKPLDEIGLGIGLYGNINPVRSFTGMNFIITIGNGK